MKEDQKYGLEIKESGEVEHCVKFGPIYNPFKVSSYFNYSVPIYIRYISSVTLAFWKSLLYRKICDVQVGIM